MLSMHKQVLGKIVHNVVIIYKLLDQLSNVGLNESFFQLQNSALVKVL